MDDLDSLDVFSLVLFSYFDIGTTWLQINIDDFTESVIFNREGILNDVGDIIFSAQDMRTLAKVNVPKSEMRGHAQHPGQRSEYLGIDTLHIRKRNLFVKDHLVERGDKVGIQEPSVEDCET